MTFRVRVTSLAKQDIQRNADWWATTHSPKQAEHWFHTVHEQLQQLDRLPESHPLSAESGEFGIELRDRLVGLGSRKTYRAIITIKGDIVFVLRLRRAAEQRLHWLDLPEDAFGEHPAN